ncbi:MAG: glycerophosphodiester phosphodiesterase, partial [Candidatus Latescibacteria bacterium]|nr:glycerophosphodiester phosphodiesterase [Candidatus Latescibacterota bacterium]
MVNVVAHKGYSGKYPENTEMAFREALALRVEMIEFDVHLSRDEALIVIHDPTVNRTS